MRITGSVLGFFFMLCGVSAVSGQENIFLDRSYWKTNPSISEIGDLMARGHDITELNENMFDPVCYALMEKVDNATVKYLLGIEGNAVDKLTHDGRTYMFWAAYRDNLEIMEYLAAKGGRADIEDSHGYSVLNFSAMTGQTNPALYDFLLAHGADINGVNHSGANALLLVSSFAEDFDILQYFIDRGLSLESVDYDGNGVFQYASKGGHLPLLKTLVDKGASYKTIDKKGESAVFMAARGTRGRQNSDEVFQYLDNLGLTLNTVNANNMNPLHLTAGQNRDVEVVHHFIKAGATADLQDSEGLTPLMNACRGNALEVVQVLQNRVNDIDARDKKGRSALVFAVASNSPEVVQFLMDRGADIHLRDADGNSLSYYLLGDFNAGNSERFEAKLNLLEEAGLKIDQVQNNGNTLLHLAARENDMALLRRLELFDIDVNQKNEEGNTALHLAAMSAENAEILKYLIGRGADLAARTDFEETVFDLAQENELLRRHEVPLDFLKL